MGVLAHALGRELRPVAAGGQVVTVERQQISGVGQLQPAGGWLP